MINSLWFRHNYNAINKSVFKLTAVLLVFLFLIMPLFKVLADDSALTTKKISNQVSEKLPTKIDDQALSNQLSDSISEVIPDKTIVDDNQTQVDATAENNDIEKEANDLKNDTDKKDSATTEDPKMPTENNLKKKPAAPDEATGALVYNYPLNLPAGRNGLQPDFSLTYNSQNRETNSWLGQGWSLSIPFIQLVNKQGIEKLYSNPVFSSSLSDELVSLGNNNYIAKVDNGEFLKYTLVDSKWVVTDKQGTKYTFGLTASGRQDDPNDASRIYKWLLEEVKDTNDNFITYQYYKDSGQIYPDKIFYTGHDTANGIFEIDFSRELRPDQVSLNKTGFVVKTNYRINNFTIKVNNNWTKKYNLTYSTGDNGVTSLLISITEQGQDQNNNIITLPATSFQYQTAGAIKWDVDTTTWTSPESIGEGNGGMVGDINGDGLDDLMMSFYNGQGIGTWYKGAYLNNGQGQFIQSQEYDPPFHFIDTAGSQTWDYGVRLIDLNGDGLLDLISSSRSVYRYVYLNTGHGWQQANQWSSPLFFVYWESDVSGQVANLNGDNLPDIIGSRLEWNGQQDVLVTYAYINNGNGWTRDYNWHVPIDVRYTTGSFFADVNGDGLDDIVQSIKDSNNNITNKVFINNGHGGWDQSTTFIPPNYFFYINIYSEVKDYGYRLIDVNGDGLVDVLKQGYGAFINNGNGWNTTNDLSWNQDFSLGGDWWTSSSPYTAYISNINGDSQPDIFRNKNDGQTLNTTVVKNNVAKVNILKKITYDTGETTDITYKATPLYKENGTATNSHLPMIIDTVTSVATNDNFGNISTTNYSYAGGYYYNTASSIADYKFAGFSKITKTDNLTKTISFYHQGNDSNSNQGEYQDHVSKIGKMYRQEVYDLNGNLFSKTINKWDRVDLGNNRNFVKLIRTVSEVYDGNLKHKDIAESYDYDNATGNKINVIQWGEVNATDNGDFVDVNTDKYITNIDYAIDESNKIIGLPATEITSDQDANKIKEARYYYDDLPLGQVEIGNQTKQEQWQSTDNYISTQKVYNQYGLVVSESDPLGQQTNYTYDVYNLYPIEIINPAGQINNFNYDYSFGKVIQSIDPNGQILKTNYDGLGRIISELQPDSNNPKLLVTKTSYEYIDIPNANSIRKSDYLDATNIVDTYIYFDGLGRKIQERQESEDKYKFKVRDFVYDQGLLLKESLPYFSKGSSYTPATTNQALYTVYSYDALKRIINTQTVLGTTSNNYNGWQTTVTDTNGKIKDLYKDAYDNLIQVNEHNGKEIYSTYYQWNGLKKLTKITDALGNVRNFSYDALGRALSAEDLHAIKDSTFGVWFYSYDEAGNLLSKTAPNGQITNYTYDDLNRILSEDVSSTRGIDVIYSYDNCKNGLGRLCSVINSSVKTLMNYDILGQLADEEKIFGKTNYTTQYNYDRQGNQILIINPDGSYVAYFYNSAGSIEKVQRKESTDPDLINVISNINYNAVGLPATMYYANGAITTNTYDDNQLYRLVHKVTVANGQNVQDLTYTYDSVGNITKIVDASSTATAKIIDYTYDDLYRLTSATISNSATENIDGPGDRNKIQTFTYDAIGNILYKSDVGNYSYDGNSGKNYANPHAVTTAGDNQYAYDQNGNVIKITSISSGQTKNLSWDYGNRLTSITINGVTFSYAYDVSGQRVKEITPTGITFYPTKDYSVDPTGIEKHIFLGDAAIATVRNSEGSAAVYSIHADHLTGSNVITNSKQGVDELTDYYSFGTIRMDQQNSKHNEKRKYTGHEYDVDTGLTYANARYYDGSLGRWLSEDQVSLVLADIKTVEQNTKNSYLAYLSDPQKLNSYAYVKNNPLRYVDVNGKDGIDFINTVDRYNPFTILFKKAYDDIYYGVKNDNYRQAANGAATVIVNGGLLIFGALDTGMALGEGYNMYQAYSAQQLEEKAVTVKIQNLVNDIDEHGSYEKHGLNPKEYGNFFQSKDQWKKYISDVISNPSDSFNGPSKNLYWDDTHGTIVIDNKINGAPTAFHPDKGKAYFETEVGKQQEQLKGGVRR